MKRSPRTAVGIGAVVFLAVALIGLVGIPGATGASQPRMDGSSSKIGVLKSGKAVIRNLATAQALPEQTGVPPSVSRATYIRLTNAHHGGTGSPQRASAQAAPQPEAPPIGKGVNCPGINQTQAGGGFPPDNELSVGPSHVVQLTNFAVSVYNKSSTCTVLKRTGFNTFFGNTTDFIFDPRTYYDFYWNRFVIMADGAQGTCPGSTCHGFFWVAISRTGDPTGSYFIYHFAISGVGNFVDFPQMGMDQDSVLFTVNIFTPTGFNAIVFAVAKARMYNGSGFAVPVFGGNPCTVAPPYVLDQNARSFFLIACPNDNKLTLKAMVNSSQPTGLPNERTRFFTVGTVAVAAYSVPPLAPQAGVNYPLETGDNRIENRTLQVGNRLIAVHTIRVGTATPKWYMVNTASAPPSVLSTGIWFATLTSSDWRPHLTAAPTATGVRCFGTWMSNDASRAIQLQVRFIGDDGGSSCGSGAGTPLFTSSLPLTSQTFPDDRHRTGDYGAAALDPNRNCAWVLGEVTNTITTWGSRYGKIGFTGC